MTKAFKSFFQPRDLLSVLGYVAGFVIIAAVVLLLLLSHGTVTTRRDPYPVCLSIYLRHKNMTQDTPFHFKSSPYGLCPPGQWYGESPLHLAAVFLDVNATRTLLDSGIDADIVSADGYTPLMAVMGCWPDGDERGRQCADLLEEGGADINYRREDGWSLLHVAVKLGNHDSVKWLLAHNVDLAAKDRKGRTALDIAIDKHRSDLADLLESATSVRNK